jgi:DNA-binding response OmpR family regulator
MAIGPTPIQDEQRSETGLLAALRVHRIDAVLVTGVEDLDALDPDPVPALALVDLGSMSGSEFADCLRRCSELKIPVIALVPDGQVAGVDPALEVDDLVVSPPRPDELVMRARRVLRRTGSSEGADLIRVGDLVINAANYEVSVKGRRAALRFKEYELLLLMATNPGRVYSRETLLNRIWGYDYLGGTRTVDVHIRRLRSKIEDADHSFIETIWNVGYRFRDLERGS